MAKKAFSGNPKYKKSETVPYDFVGLLFNHLFVFFEFLISYIFYHFSDKPVLALPCVLSFFVRGPHWLLTAGSYCWIVWGLRSLNATFPC
jgi:hypothetical protein